MRPLTLLTERLSPAQRAVVLHRGGDLRVVACAGSGKTESLSRRVAGLIAEGTDPAAIVAFTFTERAAAELRDRIVRRVTDGLGPSARDRLGPLYVGTIHAYCFRILQAHVPRFGMHDVLDENRHAGLLSRTHSTLGLSRLGARHWEPIRDFARTLDVLSNELITPAALGDTPLAECVRAHQAVLESHRFLTFGDLVGEAVRALEDPAINARVRGPLRHLLVDEYQDINPAQERLITLLAAAPVSLCVVGDDDQSIYQWRGSDVRHLRDLAAQRPGLETIVLAENRRSRPQIIDAAARFARSIPNRLDKTMTPVRDAADPAVVPWSAETPEDEAAQIADTIASLHGRGFRYRDIGILFRSVRTAAGPLLAAMDDRHIPYTCAGRTGLFLLPEVALLGELFAWFVDSEWKDARYEAARPADLDRIVSGLSGLFGDTPELPGLRTYLTDWKAFHMRGRRQVSLVEDYLRFLARLDVQRLDPSIPEDALRLGALARFGEVLEDFEHVHRRGRLERGAPAARFHGGRDRGKPYFQALHNYLVHWARDAYEEFAGQEGLDVDAVDLLTVHQAKGLEWPVVFLPSLVSGRFPSTRAGRPQKWLLPDEVFPAAVRERYEGGDSEERRLFYVALTRARDTVYLSSFERHARRVSPSPYLVEVAGGPGMRYETLPMPTSPAQTKVTELPTPEVGYSDLARLEDCGHAYRLGSVFGFPQPLVAALGYGKAIHHVLRHVAEGAQAAGGVPPSRGAVSVAMADEFYVPYADEATHQSMARAAQRLVERYVTDWPEDLRRIWAIERPFLLRLDEGTVSGRADLVLDSGPAANATGAPGVAIVDYKVSDDARREVRYRAQLALYAAAAEAEGLHVDAAWLHGLRESDRQPVDVGPAARSACVGQMRVLLADLRAGRFPAKPEAGKCGECAWRWICAHSAAA